VQGALESVEGVEKVVVSVKEKNAVVVYNAEKASIKKFEKIVPKKAGKQFKVTENSKPKSWKPEVKKVKKDKSK
jgi:copper chaperone CopZ